MDELQKRMDHFTDYIQQPHFLEKKGLGNEIPYFIFDYAPEKELAVRSFIQYVKSRVKLKIIEINLYQLLLELYEQDVGIETLLEMEAGEGTAELFDALQPTLEGEKFAQAIAQKAQGADVLFLTGVGSIYPMMRSHNILNRLHQYMTDIPVVMFYPGNYNGSELSLFNIYKDDNYYRAFRIEPAK
ncbi:DUF1788 domain-containing protein [Pelotomaculum isophthalicicum JI]|uniref:DUF1788 domain-containing protein n=1 Tax=Pelotomaculum isophthalicicum JI TaxID=947010 RepID=A0A9X4H677_9FIRM|nr:DUF1788 domain-containing protein [Pelotomaculum isophthalicicum]MDF9408219.1 DUF1788 domain-containing protein [Pelotomaculum isophthalicicum JI]